MSAGTTQTTGLYTFDAPDQPIPPSQPAREPGTNRPIRFRTIAELEGKKPKGMGGSIYRDHKTSSGRKVPAASERDRKGHGHW